MSTRDEAERAEKVRAMGSIHRVCEAIRVPTEAIEIAVQDAAQRVMSPGQISIAAEAAVKKRLDDAVWKLSRVILEKRINEIADKLSAEFGIDREQIVQAMRPDPW